MIDYIIGNKEWIFSGIGVAVLSLIFIRNKAAESKSQSMHQKGGNNSTNIQVGGNVKNSFRNEDHGNQ